MVRFILLLVVLVAGCEQRTLLQGSVTYNGEPVEKGSITFISSDGDGPGFSARVEDGNYICKQPQLGSHIAMVRGVQAFEIKSKEQFIQQREQKNNPHNLPMDYIPENANGNGQTVKIEGGSQTLDFALEGPARSS